MTFAAPSSGSMGAINSFIDSRVVNVNLLSVLLIMSLCPCFGVTLFCSQYKVVVIMAFFTSK